MKKFIEKFKRNPAFYMIIVAIATNAFSVVLSLLALHPGKALWNAGLIVFLLFVLRMLVKLQRQ